VLKCILKVVRGRTSNLPLVISLAYGLNQYYEPLGVGLVDGVLENIRAALEAPYLSSYQVRARVCTCTCVFMCYALEGPYLSSYQACAHACLRVRGRFLACMCA
jgi:hypothetical protein